MARVIYRAKFESGAFGPVHPDEAAARRWAAKEHPGERYWLIVLPRQAGGARLEPFRDASKRRLTNLGRPRVATQSRALRAPGHGGHTGGSTPLQDAAALLTLAVHAPHAAELDHLVGEFLTTRPPEELVAALVSMARSLCFVTAKMCRAIDESLTDTETLALTDDQVLPGAIGVLRLCAQHAARQAAGAETV